MILEGEELEALNNAVECQIRLSKSEDGRLDAEMQFHHRDDEYPLNKMYEYHTWLERIDLDKERKKDLLNGKGYIVSSPNGIKKDIKDPNGVFSTRFGQSLGDLHPFANRYRCECGETQSRVNSGVICKFCNTPVRKVGDQYDYYGWLVLKQYTIIHPMIFKQIDYYFGPGEKKRKNAKTLKKNDKPMTVLRNIIKWHKRIDKEGHVCDLDPSTIPDGQPFYGIGITEFAERFDEIMDYYRKKNGKKKIEYYESIMKVRDRIFTHSIPVFTTCLRPYNIDQYKNLYFEPINGFYVLMSGLVDNINNEDTRMNRYVKQRERYLYDLQDTYDDMTTEIINILKTKKGKFRNLMAGRFNYCARAVIAQNVDLRIDQLTIPYQAIMIMMEQKIKNVLCRVRGCSPNEAHKVWENAISKPTKEITDILDSFVRNGIPCMFNRNPTIQYGSFLQLFIVGYTMDLTFGISVDVLRLLKADFDGDCTNCMLIVNEALFQLSYEKFNPRNAMRISHNDGKVNRDTLPQRDTIVNSNTFLRIGRGNYSQQDINTIQMIKQRQQQLWN